MNGSTPRKSVFRLLICITISFLLINVSAHAGNIDPEDSGSRYAWGENIGWIDLEPAQGPGVTVTDTAVTGYAWGENAGWIRMDPLLGGVVNDGSGNLSGYAWGENVGWISFSCEDDGTCGAVSYGVTVDPCAGTFSGYAWGENVGWISFSSGGAVPFQVATAWRRDTDGDGIADCVDGCPVDPVKIAPGICGCGIPDTDSDADGVLDCNDNCPIDPHKTFPGVCGCGMADTDNDDDGTADCIDSDDDNDGLSDEDENSYGTDPLDPDSDNDGVNDGDEVARGTDPLTPEGPGIPILIAPEADATGIILGAFLEVGYADNASAATHQATRWQIALDEGFISLVMDVTTQSHLLTLTAPHLVLDSDTLYYWRVCFTGDDGSARDWSETGRFATVTDDRGDADGDQVPDDQEIAPDDTITIVPDTEAGWRDDPYYLAGADEAGEPFQAALRLADDGSSLLFFEYLDQIPDNCPADPDLGLFAMRIQVPEAGGMTTVRLYIDPSPLAWLIRIYKYDTVTGWNDYSSYTGFDYNGPHVTIELVDGGFGDADGTANGVIVDPLGMGTPRVSGGGGGGCFIGVLGGR